VGVRELPSWVSRNRAQGHPCLRPLGSPDALAGFPGTHPLVGCPKTHLRMGVRATVTAGVVGVRTAAHGRTPQVHSTASARAPVAVCWVSTSRRVSTSRNSLGVHKSGPQRHGWVPLLPLSWVSTNEALSRVPTNEAGFGVHKWRHDARARWGVTSRSSHVSGRFSRASPRAA
jgi:hypothetical protein